jgi:hypothetical protein
MHIMYIKLYIVNSHDENNHWCNIINDKYCGNGSLKYKSQKLQIEPIKTIETKMLFINIG